jgi:uncharacterized protein (TIGR02145 family)
MKKVSLILSAVVMTAMMLSSCGGGASKEESTPKEDGASKEEGTPKEDGASKEVNIGKQVWMTENLNVNKFRNGEPIPEATSDELWIEAGKKGEPAWCYPDNYPYRDGRGKLYNWYAVNDSRGLAPEGWKIPKDEDWERLILFLGGEKVAGNKMKSNNQWDIFDFSKELTNSSGFSGLGGGYRWGDDGRFMGVGQTNIWWCSTETASKTAWGLALHYNCDDASINNYGKNEGFSVRCLRD